jgi:hypothetical protein
MSVLTNHEPFFGSLTSNIFHVNNIKDFEDLCKDYGLISEVCPKTKLVSFYGYDNCGSIHAYRNLYGNRVELSILDSISQLLIVEHICMVFEAGYRPDNYYAGSISAVNYKGEKAHYNADDYRELDLQSIGIVLKLQPLGIVQRYWLKPQKGIPLAVPKELDDKLNAIFRSIYQMPDRVVEAVSSLPVGCFQEFNDDYNDLWLDNLEQLSDQEKSLAEGSGMTCSRFKPREACQDYHEMICMELFQKKFSDLVQELPLDRMGNRIITPSLLAKVLDRPVNEVPNGFWFTHGQPYYVLSADCI